ncbi:uncharacterized protein LOC144446277 [Glandiceps talaboti]
MSRIFAISDIHVDHSENYEWIEKLPNDLYTNDALIVAGDVTDYMPLLEATLTSLRKKFNTVFYVPGNHELWLREDPKRSDTTDSIQKFDKILAMCDSIDVHTKPKRLKVNEDEEVMVVPLFSWYSSPEDDPEDSLYLRGQADEDAKKMNSMWMDNHFCKWPKLDTTKSKYFANLNQEYIKEYDIPVISFSHFLPRRDLILACKEDNEAVEKERKMLSLPEKKIERQGALLGFNFTRFAGCNILETQIRKLGSRVHVHGHQHRNRDREMHGVRYVSHCLGYKREREEGLMWGLSEWKGPKQVWPINDIAN